MKKIENSLKNLVSKKPPESENSFSSGSGNYDKYDRSDAEKSDDSDILRLKMLTHEKNIKTSINNDLKRINKYKSELDNGIDDADYEDEDMANNFKNKKTDIDPKNMAEGIAFKAGGVDLYKRAK